MSREHWIEMREDGKVIHHSENDGHMFLRKLEPEDRLIIDLGEALKPLAGHSRGGSHYLLKEALEKIVKWSSVRLETLRRG